MPTSGGHQHQVEYFKVVEQPLPLGTELQKFGMLLDPIDGVGIQVVDRAIRRGVDHLETVMDADRMMAARSHERWSLSKHLLEVIFERVRRADFGGRPSRLDAVHVFRTREAANAFNAHYRAGTGMIYACRVESGETFDTYMDWINAGSDGGPLEEAIVGFQQRAAGYWTGATPDPAEYPETLVKGRVVLVAGPL